MKEKQGGWAEEYKCLRSVFTYFTPLIFALGVPCPLSWHSSCSSTPASPSKYSTCTAVERISMSFKVIRNHYHCTLGTGMLRQLFYTCWMLNSYTLLPFIPLYTVVLRAQHMQTDKIQTKRENVSINMCSIRKTCCKNPQHSQTS